MTSPNLLNSPMLSTVTPQHCYFMQRAIELAHKGQYTTRPNPCVGCVIVKDGRVIGEGYHYQAGRPHAEVFALRQAGENAKNATAYVTLEPCSHHGRTPPCADALIQAGIKKVVIAVTDPNPKVAGGGIKKLQQAGIEVITGVCHEEAHALNKGFFSTMSGGLPYVRLKIACSLDGRIAMANGESKWITGEAARADVQRLRAMSGAMITGSQTVLADFPNMTVRSSSLGVPISNIPQPILVVLDRQNRIHPNSDWYRRQMNQRNLWLVQDDKISPRQLLAQLAKQHQIHDVLIEAGRAVSTSFIMAGLVDEIILYQAPCLLGNTALPIFDTSLDNLADQRGFSIISHEKIGKDLRIILSKN